MIPRIDILLEQKKTSYSKYYPSKKHVWSGGLILVWGISARTSTYFTYIPRSLCLFPFGRPVGRPADDSRHVRS